MKKVVVKKVVKNKEGESLTAIIGIVTDTLDAVKIYVTSIKIKTIEIGKNLNPRVARVESAYNFSH